MTTSNGQAIDRYLVGVALGVAEAGVLIVFVGVRVGCADVVVSDGRRVGGASSSSGVAVAFDLETPVGERRGVAVAIDAPSTIPERELIGGSAGTGIGAYVRWVGVASSVAVAVGTSVGVRV